MIKIGIDPDIDKSGFALLNTEKDAVAFEPLAVHELLNECMKSAQNFGIENIKVYIEAGWLNKKANFRTNLGAGIDQKVAGDAGMNKGFGLCIMQLLKGLGFDVIEVKPLRKGLMKVKGKWTPAGRDYFSNMTGIKKGKGLNDDVRDAILLIYENKLKK